MSKNVGLMQRQMEKKLHMRLLVERKANPQGAHQKGNGHARVMRLDLDGATPEKRAERVERIFRSRGKGSRRVIAVGKLADGLVLVLEASCTQRAVARRVVANLRAFRIRIVGAVASPR